MYVKMNGNPPQQNAKYKNNKPYAIFFEQTQFYVHVWQGNINKVSKHIDYILYLTHLAVPGMLKII